MSMRDILLTVHILSAMTWFGGGIWGLMAVRRVQRVQGTEEADNLFEKMELVENRFYPPATILVLLSGIAMVMTQDAWGWGDMFVYLGLTGIVISMAMGGAVGGKINRSLKEAREADDIVQTAGLINKWLNIGRLELLILVAVVALMVYKPL